jgi:phosphoglycolate phosphatase-like HAD superfamily hydrolase
MTLSGVIFDLDGTLADTLPICIVAFRQALKEYTGRVYTDREITTLFGPSEEGVFLYATPDRAQEAVQFYWKAYEQAHQSVRAPFPGILDALRFLKEHSIRVAVVTGKGPHSAAISLRLLGLAFAFDIVESGSPLGVIKPEAIGRVLARWQLPPAEVAYVGDATTDVTSARQAGVIPLAAAWAPTADYEALRAMEPAATFRTVEEFISRVRTNKDGAQASSPLALPEERRENLRQ